MPLPNGYDNGASPIAIRPDDELNLVVANMLNSGGTGEGTAVPPQQRGTYRIPFPGGFKVQSSTFSFGGNIFVLSWKDLDNPSTPVAGYRIYAKDALQGNAEPVLVGSSRRSPCVCRVISDAATTCTFFLQPFLTSGSTLPLADCPTTTGTNPDPIYIFIADDPFSTFDAQVKIGSGLSWSGGTTVGLGITYPTATAPYDTAYATFTGVGMEAFYNGLTLHANATGVAGGLTPASTAYFFLLTSTLNAGHYYGYLSLGDDTGTGGINGNGERVVIEGRTGTLFLMTGTDTIGISGAVAATAGASAGYIIINVNGTNRKLQYFAT